MKKVLITGANGQLGCCLREASKNYKNFEFIFASSIELDITKTQNVNTFFDENKFDYCINTAAYTNVDIAESEKERVFLVNAEGVKNLSEACEKQQVILIHISTDYVFDGQKRTPYLESDDAAPINAYGASKLKGEKYISEICSKYFIIRTSWLYSQYGHNFFKSIVKLSKEKKELRITTEQIGCPTNANDLAEVLLKLIYCNIKEYGIYHFSNEGKATWYDFANAIIKHSQLSSTVSIVETDYYPTFAKRPKYSILDNSKIKEKLDFTIDLWEDSLKKLTDNKNR